MEATIVGRSPAWLQREFTGERMFSNYLRLIVGSEDKAEATITVYKSEVSVICDTLFRCRFQQTTAPVSLKKAFKSTYNLIYAAFYTAAIRLTALLSHRSLH